MAYNKRRAEELHKPACISAEQNPVFLVCERARGLTASAVLGWQNPTTGTTFKSVRL